MSLDWFTVITLKLTRDGSHPSGSNGIVVRDTKANFEALFKADILKSIRSTSWADYSGVTVSVNKYCQETNFPTPAGVVAYRELGY